jgi:integrase
MQRTWHDVVDEFCSRGNEDTQRDRHRISTRYPQNLLLGMKLLETTNQDLIKILKDGGVMTNAFVRSLHNLAIGLGWIAWPILPPKLWPEVETKPKRAVTKAEHGRIIAAETNTDRRKYYQLLWETGAAQTDAALLRAENVNWQTRVLSYQRKKTGEWAHLRIGKQLEELLRSLSSEGLLLPKIAESNASARAAEFCRRCRLLEIKGVSLHSYRYAWAQRARTCGYPQRWAQNALGHDSEAVHQAYASGGEAVCPALEEYEQKILPLVPLINTDKTEPMPMTSGLNT